MIWNDDGNQRISHNVNRQGKDQRRRGIGESPAAGAINCPLEALG